MPSLAVTRLRVLLVVDSVPSSRFTLWRLLSRSFGVLEASDAEHARRWIHSKPTIDGLIVQRDLPDASGPELIEGLARDGAPAASRAILVRRPVDTRIVVARLTGWFLQRGTPAAHWLQREADRLVS